MLRYKLLLHIYTEIFINTKTGIPVIRPIWMRNIELYDMYNETSHECYLFGENILIMHKLKSRK